MIGPDGKTQVTLFSAGSLSGANLVGTTFSDSAAASITSGTAPYTGTFKVTDPNKLALLSGQSVNGTWTLKITDTATGVTGTLNGWSLVITPVVVTSSVSASIRHTGRSVRAQLAAHDYRTGCPVDGWQCDRHTQCHGPRVWPI